MFLLEAMLVKIRSSLNPWSLRIRPWVANPLSPSIWEDSDVAEDPRIYGSTSGG